MKYKALTSMDKEALENCLLLDAFAKEKSDTLKSKALEAMEIDRAEGETYLAAYVRHLAEMNDLPVTTPAHRDVSDLCLFEPAVAKTVWFLA